MLKHNVDLNHYNFVKSAFFTGMIGQNSYFLLLPYPLCWYILGNVGKQTATELLLLLLLNM